MHRQKLSVGFTLVELLIVIVIIAILAAITVVAYNGITGRARDSARASDVAQLQKAIASYQVLNGSYPATSGFSAQVGCPGISTGYGYSLADNGTWMKPLIDANIITKAPIPPVNDCSHFYRYFHGTPTSYGCTTRTSDFYVLQVVGTDGGTPPSGAITSTWKACPEATGGSWSTNSNTWTFVGDGS